MQTKEDTRITFTCPECAALLRVSHKKAGISGPCPQCNIIIHSPSRKEESQSPKIEENYITSREPNEIIRKETLLKKQIKNLQKAILEVLSKSIYEGGTTFSDFLNITGNKGNYTEFAWVYGRNHSPCRICSTPIKRIKLNGRSSHFCPKCQQYSSLFK